MPGGRRPLPWIKLWFDMLGDPKMSRLSIAERGCWDGILLLAGQSPVRGKLMLTETTPMNISDIARSLGLKSHEIRQLKSCISKMIELNSLSWNSNDCLEVINFAKRQDRYPSDFEDYHKKAPGKLLKNSELPPEKLRKDGEGRGKTKDVDKEVTPKPNGLGAREQRADPRVNGILDEMRRFIGYPEKTEKDPIPSYGREGQAVKRMLTRGFTREEILACWSNKVSQRGGEFASMTWVNQDIASFLRGGEPLPGRTNQGGDKAKRKEHGQEPKRVKGARPPSDFSGGTW